MIFEFIEKHEIVSLIVLMIAAELIETFIKAKYRRRGDEGE